MTRKMRNLSLRKSQWVADQAVAAAPRLGHSVLWGLRAGRASVPRLPDHEERSVLGDESEEGRLPCLICRSHSCCIWSGPLTPSEQGLQLSIPGTGP